MMNPIKFLVTVGLFFLTSTTECMFLKTSCSLARIVSYAKVQSTTIAALQPNSLPMCNQDAKEDKLTDILKEAVKEELERREHEQKSKKAEQTVCAPKIPSWNVAR